MPQFFETNNIYSMFILPSSVNNLNQMNNEPTMLSEQLIHDLPQDYRHHNLINLNQQIPSGVCELLAISQASRCGKSFGFVFSQRFDQ